MLGPSMTIAGTPLALGYSVHASRRATDRGFAFSALGLAGLETLVVVLYVGLVVGVLLSQG